ncbi:MAG: hypothetical protein H0X33_12200 [Taibaiella sp.]|nr:hypothetical protein [Taibaiella sp.]
MNTTVIKERLHDYIEHADDKHLAAIYLLLEKEIAPTAKYDSDTLQMLNERVETYKKGKGKLYTVKEALESARKPNDN